VAENSNKMAWPYPSQEEDPWYDTFVSFVNALDVSGYAAREDRHAFLSEGGILSWALGTKTFNWDAAISISAPITGFLWNVPAGSVQLDDGQVMYVTLNRGPLSNTNLTPTVASTVPSSNDTYVIAARIGDVLYLRNGSSMSDGQTLDTVTGGIASVLYRNQGVDEITNPSTINFTGTGVTAVWNGSELDVTVPGSLGAATSVSRIVVGNSVNGDAMGMVTHLDNGDGTQLAAAIASAGAGDDVWIRPGTYDFRAGAQAGPIAVPAGVRIRGAGKGHVLIIGNEDGDMGIFDLTAAGAKVSDLSMYVPLPTGLCAGSTAVIDCAANGNEMEDIDIDFETGYTAGEASLIVLRSVVAVGDQITGTRCSKVTMTNVPSLRGFLATDFYGVRTVGGGTGLFSNTVMYDPTRLENTIIRGADVGIEAEQRVIVTEPEIADCRVAGIRFTDEANRSRVSGGSIVTNDAFPAFEGLSFTAVEACKANDMTLEDINAPSGASTIGINVVSGGDHSITANIVRGWDAGVNLNPAVSDCVVTANNLKGNTVTTIIQNPTQNEVAHNLE